MAQSKIKFDTKTNLGKILSEINGFDMPKFDMFNQMSRTNAGMEFKNLVSLLDIDPRGVNLQDYKENSFEHVAMSRLSNYTYDLDGANAVLSLSEGKDEVNQGRFFSYAMGHYSVLSNLINKGDIKMSTPITHPEVAGYSVYAQQSKTALHGIEYHISQAETQIPNLKHSDESRKGYAAAVQFGMHFLGIGDALINASVTGRYWHNRGELISLAKRAYDIAGIGKTEYCTGKVQFAETFMPEKAK